MPVREAGHVAGVLRVQEDGCAGCGDRFPDGVEAGVVEVGAIDVGAEGDAAEAEGAEGVVGLGDGSSRVLHGEDG